MTGEGAPVISRGWAAGRNERARRAGRAGDEVTEIRNGALKGL